MWIVALVFLAACAPETFTAYTADPSETTLVALDDNLTAEQVQATLRAIEEINTATGHTIFAVGRGPVTVTADAPICGGTGCTVRDGDSATVQIGTSTRLDNVEHELLHVILGSEHSTEIGDMFYKHTYFDSYLSDATVARIQALMTTL